MENKTETAKTIVDNEEQQFFDDWEGEREKKQQPEKTVIVPNTHVSDIKEALPKIENDKLKLPADLSSEILVGAIDTTQALVFGGLLKRKIRNRFTPDEIDKCKRFNQQIEDKEITRKSLKAADYDLLYKYNALQEVADDINFTEDEYTKLKKPLAQIIELNGYDIPPGIALSIAVAQIIAPRIADVIFE